MSYSIDDIYALKPSLAELQQPIEGLLLIITTQQLNSKKPSNNNNGNNNQSRRGGGQKRAQSQQSQQPQKSTNSFLAARQKHNASPTLKLISDMRIVLNKVTAENMTIILTECKEIYVPKVKSMFAQIVSSDEQEAFLTDLAKLLVQKAQVDHNFSTWYAQVAADMDLKDFGDILYEVCRDTLPQLHFDPDRKQHYLGALLFLVELRRFKIIKLSNLESAAERILGAIERNIDGKNVVMATTMNSNNSSSTTTTTTTLDPSVQIDVCVDLLCKFLAKFFELEKPSKNKGIVYVQKLRNWSSAPSNINIFKQRSKFLLLDFFKKVEQNE
jgi:hypothetical protein